MSTPPAPHHTSSRAAHTPTPLRRGFSLTGLLERLGPLLALALLIALAAWLDQDGRFLTVDNFMNILRQNSFVGVVALGMTFVIISGGIDLSVGSMVALLGGLGILAMNAAAAAGAPPWLSVTTAAGVMILGGPLLGSFNGLLITFGRLTPFIATLGGMAIFRSLALVFRDGGEYRSDVTLLRDLGGGSFPLPFVHRVFAEEGGSSFVFAWAKPEGAGDLRLFYPVVVFLLLAVVLHVVLKKTRFGLCVHAVGDNELAAKYSGLKIARIRLATYALMGLLCGIAAFMVSARLNSVSSAMTGQFYELDAIAAVVVGGASMRGGSGRIFGTVVGVLILGVVNNMLNMISNPDTLRRLSLPDINITHLQGLVKGLIIIAAVLVQRARN
ncbi:MAG: ABC transporter permease [Phycisphaeraceae bacterium]|nr:ABC transporter permease [Phycisphaeraceae bacterium]